MRLHLKLVALLLALTSASAFAATAAKRPNANTSARPNIVFVMVDDLDNAVWQSALDRNLLPTIKSELIDHGTTFEQMFVSQPLCCPSRATLQTGQYPQNHKVVGNHNVYEAFKAHKEKYALATWLKGAGYRTGFIGKYLNGSGLEPGYVPPGWEDWRALVLNPDEKESVVQCMYGFTLADGGSGRKFYGDPVNAFKAENYQTDVLADNAVEFIGKPDDRPFLLIVTPTAPHVEGCKGRYRDAANIDSDPRTESKIRTAPRYFGTPTVALPASALASYNEQDVTDKPRWIAGVPEKGSHIRRKNHFNEKVAALRPVDDMVKRIIDQLAATGKLDNTLIVFTSDNGYQYGTHRLNGKQDLYEESIRVPMVVRAPGQRVASTSQAWILNNDWAPTIADYADVTPPPENVVDGRSFKSLLGDAPTGTSTRQTILVRTGPNPSPGTKMSGRFIAEEEGEVEHKPYLAVRTRNPALTLESDGRVLVYAETYYNSNGTDLDAELYDLKTDPLEQVSEHASTASNRINQVQRLKAHLMLLKNCSGATCQSLEN